MRQPEIRHRRARLSSTYFLCNSSSIPFFLISSPFLRSSFFSSSIILSKIFLVASIRCSNQPGVVVSTFSKPIIFDISFKTTSGRSHQSKSLSLYCLRVVMKEGLDTHAGLRDGFGGYG